MATQLHAQLSMPVATPSGMSFGAIAPQDAFAAFSDRSLLRPTFRWQDVFQQEHASQFAVAGVMRTDILRLLRDANEGAIARGTDMADFVKSVRAQLVQRGFWGDIEVTDPKTGEVRVTRFDDARLRLIYEVNTRQSHAAGRWARGMRGRMPLILYRTMEDERVRISHRPWDLVCLPREHPFWDTHLPPNGWRCRCYFYFIDERGLAKLRGAGLKIKTEAPKVEWLDWHNKSTDETVRVPVGVDPGFAYNPGKLHVQRSTGRLDDALNRLQRLRATPAPGAAPAAQQAQSARVMSEGTAMARAAIARGRAEPAFRDFLRTPPAPVAGEPAVGLPVAMLPPAGSVPGVVSLSASDLVAQAARIAQDSKAPLLLPTVAGAWARAQLAIDKGASLALDAAGTSVLWWWRRGSQVDVLVVQRDRLVWWARSLERLTVEEALARWPRLAEVLKP